MVDVSLFSVLECPPGRPPELVYADTLRLFAEAETLGFRGAWVAEHHFSDYGTLGGPAVFLSALAARTQKLRLGVAVSILPFHDPIRIAEDYAVVDVISGGRLDFGVGRGYQPKEFAGFGVSMGEARDRFREALQVIETAWREPVLNHAGTFFKFDGLALKPKPLQRPVPVFVASVSPETFELVKTSGYSMMGSLLTNSPDQIYPRFAEHRALRPDARLPIMLPVYVADTMERAYDECRTGVAWYLDTVGKLLPGKDEKLDPSYAHFQRVAAKTSGGAADVARAMARWPIGDADRVSEFLIELYRRSTADEIICFANLGAMPYAQGRANIERIARDVLPRVRRALAQAASARAIA